MGLAEERAELEICVFGLGYVGSVTAACLAAAGHRVVALDSNPDRAALLASGRCPVFEPGLDSLIAAQFQAGRLFASSDPTTAVRSSELSLVCVGTPTAEQGGVDCSQLEEVSRQIGAALAGWRQERRHTVVYRTTMLPGTTLSVLVPLLEQSSGRRMGQDFGVAVNPEFLREGSAVADFLSPARTVIGAREEPSFAVVSQLYASNSAPVVRLTLEEAELCKYVDNAFHAMKVAFANEIGSIAGRLGVDGSRLMEVFCLDKKLNLSNAYLRPGFAFGGSCLPKDLRALLYQARELETDLPLLEAILESNEAHKERAWKLITGSGKSRIGILGLSFKPGTADLRESPVLELAERLVAAGCRLAIYDRQLAQDSSLASGLLPEPIASRLVPDLEAVLASSELVVIAHRDPEFAGVSERLRPGAMLVNLAGLSEDKRSGVTPNASLAMNGKRDVAIR